MIESVNRSHSTSRPSFHFNKRFVEPFFLGFLVMLSIFLGIFRIGVGEQHVDVYQVMGVFRLSWGQLMADFFTQPTGLYGGFQAPIYFLLAKAYGSLFGSNVVQLAVFSVVALALLVLLSWFIYPLLTKDANPYRRFLFVFLVASSPVHVWWAQTAKYDMWFALISVIGFAAGLWFIQKRDVSRLIFFSISVATVTYTHYFGFILLASQFCVLGLLALYRRDKTFFAQIAVAGVLVSFLVAPLLPVVIQAAKLRVAEHYHFTEQTTGIANTIRGVLVEQLFGYGLIASHGFGVQIAQAIPMILKGQIPQALFLLRDAGILLLATVFFVITLSYTVFKVIKQRSIQENALYIIGVPVLSFVFSQLIHFAFRFSYLSAGTWIILAFFAIGLSHTSRRIVFASFVAGMIVLYTISLTTYYQNMELRYPGMGLVADYINSHSSDFQTIVIEQWITDNRGTDHEYSLPSGIPVYKISAVSDLPLEEIKGKKTLAFFAGRPEQVLSDLNSLKTAEPNFSWNWLISWNSLEMSESSIHAVQISYGK